MIKAAGVDEVTDTSFGDEVLRAEGPVLVEFTAEWCPPCHQLAPVLSAVAAEVGAGSRSYSWMWTTTP